jgi:hypothetical protein
MRVNIDGNEIELDPKLNGEYIMSESETSNVDLVETTAESQASNLMEDVELAIELVKTLKKHLDVSHPSVTSLVRKLLFS